jgi:hypothetical protein
MAIGQGLPVGAANGNPVTFGRLGCHAGNGAGKNPGMTALDRYNPTSFEENGDHGIKVGNHLPLVIAVNPFYWVSE